MPAFPSAIVPLLHCSRGCLQTQPLSLRSCLAQLACTALLRTASTQVMAAATLQPIRRPMQYPAALWVRHMGEAAGLVVLLRPLRLGSSSSMGLQEARGR
jgi:hypothetical protein